MQILIASDDPATAERLRAALSTHGVNCPLSRVVSLDAAVPAVAAAAVDLVLLVVSSSLDQSIKALEEVRRRSRAAIIAVGAARDPHQILRIVHAGPDDYLDIDDDFATQLQRTLNRIRAAAPDNSPDGRLITFVSHTGGSGCSFLATNLAVALAGLHSRCGLCDFNLRRGDLATFLNVKPRFSVSDLSRNIPRLDQGVIEQALIPHESGVHLLAAPPSLADVHPITSEAAEQMVRLLRNTFPYVVADLEDFFHAEQMHLLKSSSTVCFVLRLDFTALRNTRRTLEYLEREGLDPGRVQIIVNQFGRPKEIMVGQAEKVLDRKLSFFIPFDQRTAVSSLNRGVPVMWESPKSKMGRAIRRVAEHVSQSEAVAV
jgi:pilus assembly protein CpaE